MIRGFSNPPNLTGCVASEKGEQVLERRSQDSAGHRGRGQGHPFSLGCGAVANFWAGGGGRGS